MGSSTVARASSFPERSRDASAAASPSASGNWANAAPLALTAFAVVTFMLSMVNAGWVDKGVAPVVSGVALMFGGGTQLIAGFICLRNGNVFTGTLFSTYGASWLAYFANVSYFLKQVPPAQAGHALGLFLREGRRFSSSKAERGAVVELGTKSTTRVPHRPSRAAAGRSRSQPVRSATKCLL